MMNRWWAALMAWLCLAANVSAADREADISLIPWPASLEMTGGALTVEPQTQIVVAGDAPVRVVAHYFSDLVERSRGWRPVIVQGTVADAPKRAVVFTLESGSAGPEAYTLDVTSKGAVVSASDPRGLFNGAVTLWQLLTMHTAADAREVRVPGVRIIDAPRLRWRGLLLDSARQYQSVAFIKRYIDFMALHKLNVLHWRLVDDRAWRLQIPKYPKLTGGMSSYTADDVREVIAHAAARNVTVVPGLEMPGGAAAAATGYPSLRAADAPAVGSNLYNIEEETFVFFDNVFAHVTSLFPSEFIHIGAADVSKDQWKQSTSVQERMRELGIINEQRVQRYFFERISALTQKYQRRIVGWDSVFSGGVPQDTVIMTGKGLDGALGAVASGYEVVVSSHAALSFNLAQSATGNEPVKPGGVLSLGDVYRFDPAPSALGPQDLSRLIGVQGNVWTTPDDNEEEVEALTFPRAAALAEVAWTAPKHLHWAEFQPRMVAMLNRYSRMGVRYSDEAFRALAFKRGENGGKVSVELAKQVPLGEIRYTLNGSEPNAKSPVYTDVFDVPRVATIKAAVFYNGEQLSRTTSVNVATDIIGSGQTE
jgi:hexosaminidase